MGSWLNPSCAFQLGSCLATGYYAYQGFIFLSLALFPLSVHVDCAFRSILLSAAQVCQARVETDGVAGTRAAEGCCLSAFVRSNAFFDLRDTRVARTF